MNKIFIFSYFLFLNIAGFAQNYRPVQWATPHFFAGPYYIRAINIDSLDYNGSDTLLYNFFSINEFYPDTDNCVEVFGPSWIGHRIIVRSDSLFIFLNYYNDSIYIHPLAAIGSTWSFFHPVGSSNINALVTGIAPIVIDGSPDSIKTIRLSNGSEIILSKDHGFYKLIPFRDFPNDTNSYILNDALRLTNGNVFDFDVGDTLQYRIYQCTGPFGGCSPGTNITKVVTGKNFSSGNDTVYYSFFVQTVITVLVHDSTGYHINYIITDTISSSFYTNLNDPLILLMPEETDTTYNSFFDVFGGNGKAANRYQMTHAFCEREIMKTLSGDYQIFFSDSCFFDPFEPTVEQNGYCLGLGKVLSGHYECIACGGTSYFTELISYHKATSSCGTIQIFTSINKMNDTKSNIKIHPNPISSQGYFFVEKNDNSKTLFELIDISGKVIYSNLLSAKISVINANEIAYGFYIYRLTYFDGNTISGKLIR